MNPVSFVELTTVVVEGALDFVAGRPRETTPYPASSAPDLSWAWTQGWDEAAAQFPLAPSAGGCPRCTPRSTEAGDEWVLGKTTS